MGHMSVHSNADEFDCVKIYGKAGTKTALNKADGILPLLANLVSNFGNHKGAGKGINWARSQAPKPSQGRKSKIPVSI